MPRAHDREDTDRDVAVGFGFEMGMPLVSSQHPIQLLSRCAALFICESLWSLDEKRSRMVPGPFRFFYNLPNRNNTSLKVFLDEFSKTPVWMAYCGLERKMLIFLAGGLPADSLLLEKYLNMAHYIANLLLSQATHHMWVTPCGENTS